jgi:hypothetical protein
MGGRCQLPTNKAFKDFWNRLTYQPFTKSRLQEYTIQYEAMTGNSIAAML